MDLIYISKHLNTQRKCVQYLEQKRWDGVPTCPYCGSQQSSPKHLRYTCLNCNNSYSVTVGTVFEDSNLPLKKWFMAISLILSAKKGLSSMQLSRDLSVNKNTAWLLQMKVRNVMREGERGLLEEIFEAEESLNNGSKHHHAKTNKTGESQMHHVKRVKEVEKQQRNVVSSANVTDLRKSNMPTRISQIRAKSAADTNASLAHFPAKKHFDKYMMMSHSSGIFIHSSFRSSAIKGFCNQFRRAIIGQYHKISLHYLQFYLDELDFKSSHRASSDRGYNHLLCQMLGN